MQCINNVTSVALAVAKQSSKNWRAQNVELATVEISFFLFVTAEKNEIWKIYLLQLF